MTGHKFMARRPVAWLLYSYDTVVLLLLTIMPSNKYGWAGDELGNAPLPVDSDQSDRALVLGILVLIALIAHLALARRQHRAASLIVPIVLGAVWAIKFKFNG